MLVVQTAFIGDVVLVIPLLEAVKILWVEAQLDVLVRPPSQNLLETLPFVRQVWVYDKLGQDRGSSGLLKMQRRLRQQNYDLALLPHRSFRSGWLTRLAKIPVRVGFDRDGGRWFHTHKVPYPATLHEIQRNLQLLSPFGLIPQVDPPTVISSEEDVQVVAERMAGAGVKPCVALAPGSVWETKRWPEVYFSNLGKKLLASGFFILLLGGREDRELCHKIASTLGPEALNLAGELTLRQSVEALRRCTLLVTNDSAPTHLGVAAGIRVLTLFGSTIPEFGFAPYGPKGDSLGVELYCRPCTNHGRPKCPERHFRCLRELTVERVFHKVQTMVNSAL